MDDSRLTIATRIDSLLRHYLGEGIDVEAMLRSDAYACDVLRVCAASDAAELVALVQPFFEADAADEAFDEPAQAGVTDGAPLAAAHALNGHDAAAAQRQELHWLRPSTWLAALQA